MWYSPNLTRESATPSLLRSLMAAITPASLGRLNLAYKSPFLLTAIWRTVSAMLSTKTVASKPWGRKSGGWVVGLLQPIIVTNKNRNNILNFFNIKFIILSIIISFTIIY
jgi:hypothetical protein